MAKNESTIKIARHKVATKHAHINYAMTKEIIASGIEQKFLAIARIERIAT